MDYMIAFQNTASDVAEHIAYAIYSEHSDDGKKHNVANTYVSSVYYQGGIGFA